MKILSWFFGVLILLLVGFSASFLMTRLDSSVVVHAEDEIDRIGKQIEELQRAKQMSEDATKPLEMELGKLDGKLLNTQAAIDKASANLIILSEGIIQREKDFDLQYEVLARNVEKYYKHLRAPSPFYFLLSAQTAAQLAMDLSYQSAIADEEKELIAKITADLLSLEKDKKRVELDKVRLAHLQTQLDVQAGFFRKEIKGAKDYQASLASQIASLSAKQQELIARRLSSLNLPTSLGAGPLFCTDDRELDPGFSPAFAFFTYGIPHRVGMNQYGAYGRAQAGQSHQQILQAYFNGISFERRDPNMMIKVQGYGEMALEQYMLGIYEMPDSWPIEALKAQAVAARSYVLSYTNNGQGEICTTQACQVYKGGE